ncbi:MAG TPA: hypothetical protein VN851_23680 [Thermoanaerobaculia bacterium]|nr:hypothetical protein [Thermoanaerobaculia bacterium]
MKRALLLSALTLGLLFAMPRTSSACYDFCSGAPGTCRTCETGFDLTFQVCVQTQPCKCITYFVPSYQCTGLTAGQTSPPVPAFAWNETPIRSEVSGELSPSGGLR